MQPSSPIRSLFFDFDAEDNKLKSVAFFTLLLSVFFIPLSAEMQITNGTRLQFPLELFAPATALLTVIGVVLNRKRFKFSFNDLAVLLFLAVAGISVIYSLIPSYSLKAFVVLAAYATTFYFGFRFLNLNSKQWQLVWRVLMAAFMLLMFYTLFRYFSLGVGRQNSYEMSLPFIPGHTLLVAIGFPAFLYAFNQLLSRVEVKFNLLYVLLFSFVTAISYSRIYWVILLACAFILVFYHFRKLRIGMLVSSVILMIAGGIIYHQIDTKRDREGAWNDPEDHNSLFVQIQSILVWEKNESNIERSNRWKVAREIFEDHPAIGSGLSTYPDVYFRYKGIAGIEETHLSGVKMNAHQIYLGWLSDMGIAGVISGIILFISFLLLAIRLRGSPHFILALLLFLNFVLLGTIEDYTTLEKIMAVFWISIAFLYHLNLDKKASN